jgi:hypothetical protein
MGYTFEEDHVLYDVVVKDADGKVLNKVPPQYCASLKGGAAFKPYLAELGFKVEIVLDTPQVFDPSSPLEQSQKVVWFDDTAGRHINGGSLIWNYRPGGLPYSMAENTTKSAFTLPPGS